MITVSVIMSVYKEPLNWLRQSIESILHQTFTDLEFIIICDNPSYTEGLALLREYEMSEKRIVLLVNDENIGLTRSLNKGLKIAKGKYIARMDADDISDVRRLEIQYQFMENNPDITVCGTGRTVLNNDRRTSKTYNTYTQNRDIRSVFVLRSAFTHPTVMFRRSITDEGYLYDESFVCAQDYDLWERLIEKGYNFANIDLPLLSYRMSNIQVSKKKNDIQVANAKIIRKRFLAAIDVFLTDEELSLMVLPFAKNVTVSRQDIGNYVNLLYYIQCEMEKKEWFNTTAFQTEAVRFSINLALRCKYRWSCLWDVFCSPLMSFSVLKNNLGYYYHRI